MAFVLNPYNLYDGWFDDKVRKTLSMFHINLGHGRYAANGPMVSVDVQWNRNGGLQLSQQDFVDSLTGFNETFHGLQAPDRYHIVDGNVGAVLYRLQGPQTGEFEGIPSTGKLLDIWGGELMQFDSEAKSNYLITIEEFAIAIQQLSGNRTVKTLPPISLYGNPQTSPNFRQTLKNKMASIHRSRRIARSCFLIQAPSHCAQKISWDDQKNAIIGVYDSQELDCTSRRLAILPQVEA